MPSATCDAMSTSSKTGRDFSSESAGAGGAAVRGALRGARCRTRAGTGSCLTVHWTSGPVAALLGGGYGLEPHAPHFLSGNLLE